MMTPWRLPRSRLYRSLGKVTPEMLRVMPNHDVLSKTKFKTCAVVGSAGLLLRWELGPEIDQHDAVFRFNIAPAKVRLPSPLGSVRGVWEGLSRAGNCCLGH